MNFQFDHGAVSWPAIVVHGGAGTYERLSAGTPGWRDTALLLEEALAAALDAGWAPLAGGDPVEAVVAAVEFLENHGGFNAGRGSVPNSEGGFEMDAAVMDDAGRAGAVACVVSHSPIRAARAVMQQPGPLLLAGPNAEEFAARSGVPRLHPGAGPNPRTADPAAYDEPLSEEGTVGAIAVSRDGRFAAATSTGGRPGQLPGRVGDTPIPGAGLWAQPGGAVSATGTGEAFILSGFSRMVGSRVAAREQPRQALRSALEAVYGYGGTGGGIVLGPDGTWAAAFSTVAMARGVRHRDGRAVTVLGPAL